ncbi:hypothetical protein AN958_05485 [Leucoagaricus sp. SymC.cos]|nr:hypothetical protein AN958_05485 [Leucoagaricus sp. SymC.cos]
MSRFTASPFHKPSPFVFPREPVSPPETLLTDSGYANPMGPSPANNEHCERNEDHVPFTHADTPSRSRLSRPSISYQNSGFREPPSRPVQRNYRFFVVVIPPPGLINQHGQLGHTLASGPSHRLSQGIIMPLFPTMYGQLTAIAKEFNFPSTTGLCLYLHFNENGVVMTPRISDESWHMLWSHLFDMSSNPRGLPIGGKVEFDIDFQQARWYSAWLSTMVQDHVERPFSHVPSNAPSIAEHRDSIDSDLFRDSEPLESSQVQQPRNTPNQNRHVPKKLSLVDRFDSPVSRPDDKVGPTQALGLPDEGVPTSKALSPIAQEEEPQSAREQLDNRVKSWRAGASTKPTSLAGRGQTSLDPANLPNSLSLDGDTPSSAGLELNLEDFTWSISSVGPDDYDVMSIGSPSERLPSPDIARRMLEDSPPTPSTVTSWGAPLSYPPTPLSDYRPPSLDLAFRAIFSPPLTPSTATSWGPESPVSSFDWYQDVPRAQSIHLGERGDFSRPVTPSTATTWGAPLSYPPTPATPFFVHTPDVAHRSFDFSSENENVVRPTMRPWPSVWPYFNARNVAPTSHELRYPFFLIYPSVYPHFDMYPAVAASTGQKIETETATPIKVALESHYPSLQIFAPVYPHNLVIYPEVKQSKETLEHIFVVSSQYPIFDLYPVLYPYFNLYPAIASIPPHEKYAEWLSDSSKEQKKISYGIYPNLVIYPAVYPHFDIYPAKTAEVLVDRTRSKLMTIKVAVDARYPNLNIYPPIYPHLEIYPAPSSPIKEPAKSSLVTVSQSQYPLFDLYPAVYPHFNIYPPKLNNRPSEAPLGARKATVILQSDAYPVVRPYPPVYPYFDLYPSKTCAIAVTSATEMSVLLSRATAYPTFNIYPAVYPNFILYPLMAGRADAVDCDESVVILPRATAYPTFDIYPTVHPDFCLYPLIAGEVDITGSKIAMTVAISHYPYLHIYDSVYPHLCIYPSISAAASSEPQPPVKVHITLGSISTTTQPHARLSRKSHHDLHQEVFHDGPVRTPSGTGMHVRPEVELRPLNVLLRPSQRRIATTRSPTGPALHRPATPPALPSPSRRLPSPPPLPNGARRSPNVMEQMAEFKAEGVNGIATATDASAEVSRFMDPP